MEEIQSYSDNYRSSSSSASSPINKAPSGAFFYLRKPGALRKPISFEDSPEWDDVEIDPHIEGEDSIHVATTTASPSHSKVNSGSLPSPSAPEASSSVAERKIAGASIVWKDLCVTIKEKRKYSDKVIKSSNGYAFPGTLTVIMGPARSGKSTLLRAIAVVKSVMDGYNICIFAYGQTGTGKTFTMEGTPECRGVNYRALEELFRIMKERMSLMRYEFSFSMLEVYNEKIRDLLADNSDLCAKKLDIKQSAEGTLEVPGLAEIQVCSVEEVWEMHKLCYSIQKRVFFGITSTSKGEQTFGIQI